MPAPGEARAGGVLTPAGPCDQSECRARAGVVFGSSAKRRSIGAQCCWRQPCAAGGQGDRMGVRVRSTSWSASSRGHVAQRGILDSPSSRNSSRSWNRRTVSAGRTVPPVLPAWENCSIFVATTASFHPLVHASADCCSSGPTIVIARHPFARNPLHRRLRPSRPARCMPTRKTGPVNRPNTASLPAPHRRGAASNPLW